MPSRLLGVPAGNRSGLEAFARLREQLNEISEKAGEYCGLPPMIDGERLIVEPRHRAYKAFQEMNREADAREEDDSDQCKLINSWWSRRRQVDVMLWQEPDGRFQWGQMPAANHLKQALSTMGCAIAWSVSAEAKAMEKLAKLIPTHLWQGYFLTGMFIETSKRSGVTYVFRRSRPTVALRPDARGQMRVLCCLCAHPVGYYQDTWAGTLVPTDEVIAALLVMRADEPYMWRKANQIPAYRPEAGL